MRSSVPAGALDRRPERGDIVARGLRRLCPRGDEGRASARLEHRERALRHVAADGVEDGVAIARGLREIPRVVVDDFIGAEPAHVIVVRRTRGRDHVGADMLGELNGEAGDPACPALDEDRLAGPSFNVSSMALSAVRPVSARAAALTCERRSRLLRDDGSLDRDLLRIRALLARLAERRTPHRQRSRSATPSPTALTTPEKSRPRTYGNFVGSY